MDCRWWPPATPGFLGTDGGGAADGDGRGRTSSNNASSAASRLRARVPSFSGVAGDEDADNARFVTLMSEIRQERERNADLSEELRMARHKLRDTNQEMELLRNKCSTTCLVFIESLASENDHLKKQVERLELELMKNVKRGTVPTSV